MTSARKRRAGKWGWGASGAWPSLADRTVWMVRLLPTPTVTAAVRAAALAVAATRIAKGARRQAGLSADATVRSTGREATVVVPARDEAMRIGPCIHSLVRQGARVIVVDDGSSDSTRSIAEAVGADVIDAGELPDGWAGKAHALQVGIEAATTDVVICVDADCRFEPGFVAAMAGALGENTMISAGTRVDAPDPLGRIVHASMLASLVYRLGPPGVPATRADRTMANGQCMAFDRGALLQAGGFEPVAGNLIEDLALARSLAHRGHDVAFLDATALVIVEGYGSARATWDGWGRSLALADVTSPAWLAADLAVVWAAMALPLPRLLSGRGDIIDIAAVALRFGVVAATAGAFRPADGALVLAPYSDLAVAARLTAGALRPSRTWRGRTYA